MVNPVVLTVSTEFVPNAIVEPVPPVTMSPLPVIIAERFAATRIVSFDAVKMSPVASVMLSPLPVPSCHARRRGDRFVDARQTPPSLG